MTIIIISFCLAGCSSNQNINSYDRTCTVDSDCKQACPIGCINNNEEYKNPGNTDCVQMFCKCENNMCTP